MTTELSFEAIGTKWSISFSQPKGDPDELRQKIFEEIETYDKVYSRFRTDSLVSQIAAKTGIYKLPSSSKTLFEIYRSLYELTDGTVSPLVGQTLSDAGYDKDYSLKFNKITTAKPWDEIIAFKEHTLTVKEPVLLDFGAAGKGQLVDIISDMMNQSGIAEYTINAGGDMFVHSFQPIDIALQHPVDQDLAVGVAHLANQAICGSSIHLRKWGDHNHIIDPRSGKSPHHITALWVVSETTILSDILTTALFFVEPETLQKNYDFEYAIIYQDQSLVHSKNFPGTFFE
jgi:thiamine biosynthesis lipoprotein